MAMLLSHHRHHKQHLVAAEDIQVLKDLKLQELLLKYFEICN
jgi:hypothetical protein